MENQLRSLEYDKSDLNTKLNIQKDAARAHNFEISKLKKLIFKLSEDVTRLDAELQVKAFDSCG